MIPLSHTNTLVLATGNLGKVAEFNALLAPLDWQVQSQSVWQVPECPEPYGTFIENALAKARHAAAHTGLPALADDSGLCVKALEGEPGVYSARYACQTADDAKDDAANITKLLHALRSLNCHEIAQRAAYFVCVLVAVKTPQDPEPLIAIGRWHGYIAETPSGTNGFGYDPVFVCGKTARTAATLSQSEKSAISHRGQATQQLVALIQSVW
jgi:XTP/dITP diphosphohydrolase